MTTSAGARDPRRTAAGLGLIGAPVLMLLSAVVASPVGGGDRAYLEALAAEPLRNDLSALLFLLGLMLLVPGVVGAVLPVVGRGVTLANAGAALALPGLMAFAGLVTTSVYGSAAVRVVGVDETLRIDTALGGPLFGTVLVLALAGMPIGILLVLLALWRAGHAAWWPAGAWVAGVLVVTIGDGILVGAIGTVLLGVALVPTGLRLLRPDPTARGGGAWAGDRQDTEPAGGVPA